MPVRALYLSVVLALCAASCGEKLDPVRSVDLHLDDVGRPVSYLTYVRPIVEATCLNCHSKTKSGDARNGAPVLINFDTYEQMKKFAVDANELMQAGVMPPPSSRYQLTERDLAIIELWIADGLQP